MYITIREISVVKVFEKEPVVTGAEEWHIGGVSFAEITFFGEK